MIFTARQLEDLHKNNGHVTLPVAARLTPLAQDWLRAKKIAVRYLNGETASAAEASSTGLASSRIAAPSGPAPTFLWWCDAPCGPAKAALMAQARETNLKATEIDIAGNRIVEAIKFIAREVKESRANGGILFVENGSLEMVYANLCPSLRAVLGTCREAVDQAVQQAAANVLVIEHPFKTLQQTKALLARFCRGPRELSEEMKRQLQELATCA